MYSKCKYFIKTRLRRFVRSPDLLSKASGDASYCNLLLRIEGIALQGSFLHTLVSGFTWSHAIRSKGTGLQSPAPPLLKSPPALCRANSSHRLCRMLRSPELYSASPNGLGLILSFIFF